MRINTLSTMNSILVINNNSKRNPAENTFQIQDGFDYAEYAKSLLSSKAPSAADPRTNSINIKAGEIKNIGSVDGFPLNINLGPYGLESSFGIMVRNDEPVNSPRNQLAWELFNKYTPAQREKAGLISSSFNLLYQAASGSISVSDYNSYKKIPGIISASQLLSSLGIDVSKPFSFNGNSFSLDSQGNLHTLYPADGNIVGI